MIAGVDCALQGLRLRELGQHLGECAAALVGRRTHAFSNAVVALRELQREIPEWLHCVRLVLAG